MNARSYAIAALVRYGMYVAGFVAAFCGVAFLVGDWHRTDAAILGRLLSAQPETPLLRTVVPVDLDAPAGSLRPPLLRLLTAVDARAARGLSRPRAIVFDVAFTKDGGDRTLLAPLGRELAHLTAEGIELYGAFHFDPSATGRLDANFADAHENAIYQYLTVGHTEIHHLLDLPLAFYMPVLEPSPDQSYKAVPLLLEAGRAASATALRQSEPIIIRPGAHAAYRAVASRGVAGTIADDASLAGAVVLVGNDRTELVQMENRTGFELLTWAVDAREVMRLDGPQSAPFFDTRLMLTLALVAAGIAAGTFALAFRTLRGRARAVVPALLAPPVAAAFLAFVEWQLVAHGALFAQLSLPLAAILIATGVSLWWGLDTLRRERLLADMRGPNRCDVARYDVFISYARDPENARWVERNVLEPLQRATLPDGRPLRVFFDRQSIKVGFNWYSTLVDGICESRYFIPVYSEGYFGRPFCVDELDIAMVRRVDNPAFRIFPVARVVTGIPVRYSSLQYVDATAEPAFIAAILAQIQTTTRPLEITRA